MWQVALAFSVASGFASARETRKAGEEAFHDARMQAAEVRRQKFDIELIASQNHRDRMELFKETVAFNEAATAMTGRTGRSIAALRKREQDIYGRDVDRIRETAQREREAVEREATGIEQRGRSARSASRRKATSTLLQTGVQAASLYGGQ